MLTAVDVRKTLREKLGEDMESYLILGACNPHLAHQALTADRYHARRDVKHFRIHGKRSRLRYVPAHPKARRLVHEYLERAGHADYRLRCGPRIDVCKLAVKLHALD